LAYNLFEQFDARVDGDLTLAHHAAPTDFVM
jgi:hypothetical protein